MRNAIKLFPMAFTYQDPQYFLTQGNGPCPDYERYTLEIALGGISEALGDLKTADYWYVKALETASSDPTTSVGLGLLRLLELRRGRGFDEEERRLAEKALRQSWRLLQIEGEPNLDDLEATTRKLLAEQGRR